MLCVFIINIVNYLELRCNIDNFAVRKWFREVYHLPDEKGIR